METKAYTIVEDVYGYFHNRFAKLAGTPEVGGKLYLENETFLITKYDDEKSQITVLRLSRGVLFSSEGKFVDLEIQ